MAELLPLIATLGTIASTALKISNELSTIVDSYQTARSLILSLSNECRSTSWLLDNTQKILSENKDFLQRNDLEKGAIQHLEESATGIKNITKKLERALAQLHGHGAKAKVVLRNGTLRTYRDLLRAHKSPLETINTSIQSKMLSELHSRLAQPGEQQAALSAVNTSAAGELPDLVQETRRTKGTMKLSRELHYAVSTDDVDTVQGLLDRGADPDAPLESQSQESNYTPLHRAAASNSCNIIRLLLEYSADIDANWEGETPLFRALWNQHPEAATLLIKHGADVSIRNRSRYTPLHYAVMKGMPAVASTILGACAEANCADAKGYSPLHHAAALCSLHGPNIDNHNSDLQRCMSAIQLLLKFGASTNYPASNGATPLHTAQHPKLAKLLLDHGADPRLRDEADRTPLHLAIDKNKVEEALVLLKHPNVQIDARDDEGCTPFLNAAYAQNLLIMKRLVARGTDVLVVNNAGANAMNFAKHPLTASFLLGMGLDINHRNKWDTTILHAVAWLGNADHVRWFLEMGADPSIRTTGYHAKKGTAGYLATIQGHSEAAKALNEWEGAKTYSEWDVSLAGSELSTGIHRLNVQPQDTASRPTSKVHNKDT